MIQGYPLSGVKRYVGEKKSKVVHDLLFEKKGILGNCGLDRIAADRLRTFDPDSLKEAKKHGYRPCPTCLWTEQ